MNASFATESFIFKVKNNKDTIYLIFTLENNIDRYTTIPIYNVMLEISRKRKHFGSFEKYNINGSGDITSLIKAKEILKNFIDNFTCGTILHKFPKIKLEVYALDKRRMNIYKRALLPLGFQIDTKTGEELLFLYLERDNNF